MNDVGGYQARLIILHVAETLGPENLTYGEAASQPQPERYRERLWDELRALKPSDPGIAVEYVLSDEEPVAAIIRIATERNCDLIVLGSHEHRGIRRFFAEHVAERVVRGAPCAVLVVVPKVA